ncbi:glycoside hydrolase family 78 protein [Cucurbitaria berberidis CBS 394.84]|uniref:Glycoside hydrolase family 78 protein n=1 Tax=Cucurbitaria berberidis CBS 394.84 TaxID=1168544 RepID=A0A9P4LBD8_9PLEO|nr:glycoside hydrolase family 78 protein [Cucurbitaria berberidis CBS 394.84]KAF1849471.1 glycoside hydrolase family 78 protein [Cucurbitaria berberidis CBS 394.84]
MKSTSFRYVDSVLQLLIYTTVVVASPNPWNSYIHSPASRYVKPASVHSHSGSPSVISDDARPRHISLGAGDQISLDFGIEVGGWISLNANINNSTNASAPQFSLAFAESPAFANRSISDDTGSTPAQNWDQALNVTLSPGSDFYRIPEERFRGGFRFLMIHAFEKVEISNVTCEIGFAPQTKDLRNYGGHFYTPDDDMLVRAWYAGAYTVQTNIAPRKTGRWLPQVRPGWAYNNSIGVGESILVDGAKRDRAVWPGDLGIQGVTAALALGADGLTSVKNALETLFYYQNSTTGRFPFAGPATGSFRSGAQSDTYHAWSLIAIFNYAIFVSDEAWLMHHWTNITRGIDFITAALDDNEYGLHNQTQPNDWARQGGGGYNSALNALDYHALTSFANLASALSKNTIILCQATQWATASKRLKKSYNALLWSDELSLYHDNQTTTLTPQDGNALALLYNLTTSSAQASRLSASLTKFWTPLGPVTPELPDTISPLISSVEVLAHFAANEPLRALNLTRTLWTYLLDSPLMTGSTLAEGISANGSLYYRGNAGYKNDASYTSLSHGWSSGPSIALSQHVAGLEIVAWRRWRFRPAPAGLKSVNAGFDSPLGRFAVAWEVLGAETGCFDFVANVTTATGTEGSLELPWVCRSVVLDGQPLADTHVYGGGTKKLEAKSCL